MTTTNGQEKRQPKRRRINSVNKNGHIYISIYKYTYTYRLVFVWAGRQQKLFFALNLWVIASAKTDT